MKKFDGNLKEILTLVRYIYVLVALRDKYFYKSDHGESDATSFIENIKFNLDAIYDYHFSEDDIKSTDYVKDDETAAHAIIEIIMDVINFMVDYTSPIHIHKILLDGAGDLAESIITSIRLNGIDTTGDVETAAYAYKVLGKVSSTKAEQISTSISPSYFDTDSVIKPLLNKTYGIVFNERGAGKKLYDYEQAIKRIKKTLQSDLSLFNMLDEIAGTIEALDNSLNGINTTEVRDIITDRKESE